MQIIVIIFKAEVDNRNHIRSTLVDWIAAVGVLTYNKEQTFIPG